MRTDNLLSGTFCLAALALMAAVISSSASLKAQHPGDAYTASGCGEFSGKLCKTVKVSTCDGNRCTVETSYYYYSTNIE